MTQPTSLSGFWRVNKSADKAVELKQLQECLQSLAGTLAKSKGRDIRVVWDQSISGLYVDHPRTSVFALDASPVMDISAPVPDSRVDVLAGQVLHHVGHMVVPTREAMRQKIIRNILRMRDSGKVTLHDGSNAYNELGIISRVIQEWRVDSYLSNLSPAIKGYIASARSWYRDAAQDRIQNAVDRCASGDVTFKDVVDLWSLILCYDLPVPDKIDSRVANALVEAITESEQLAEHPRYMDRVVQAIWQAFNTFARVQRTQEDDAESQSGGEATSDADMPGDTKQSSFEDSEQESSEGENAEEAGEEDKVSSEDENGEGAPGAEGGEEDESLEDSKPCECPACGESELFDSDNQICDSCGYSESPPDLDTDTPGYFASALDQQQRHLDQDDIQSVKDAIESEREDIAQALAGNVDGMTMIMQLAPDDQALADRLFRESMEQSNALGYLFQNWHRAKSRYIRGTEQGNLDQRLLYRGGLRDNHVFRAREIIQKLDMALCVLIDASSSIHSDEWDIIVHCAAAFAQSMGNTPEVDLIVLGYNSVGGIYRVWDPARRQLRVGFRPTASTPTASAIAACQDVVFKRFSRRRDKLIIHITDACPNNPNFATEQILRARRSGIQVALVETPTGYAWSNVAGSYQASRFQHVEEAYGPNHVSITDWHELPSAMESLLRTMLAQR